MLFHTWPFFIFMLIVLPGFYLLRKISGPWVVGVRILGCVVLVAGILLRAASARFVLIGGTSVLEQWVVGIGLCLVGGALAAGKSKDFWVVWLLAASYFFYGYWNPIYLALVFYSTALDYLLVTLMDHCPPTVSGDRNTAPLNDGRRKSFDPVLLAALIVSSILAAGLIVAACIGPSVWQPTCIAFAVLVSLMAVGALVRNRRIWLIISLVNNLALLLFFKYAGFVQENLALLFPGFDFPKPATFMPPGWSYVLPVGISFFTFQSMSYTIDFYLGKVARERNFLRFATFVCFFPQLMAGPIERAKQMLPQLQNPPPWKLENITDGLSLFLVGLFKKLALANYLALYVNQVYNGKVDSFGAMRLILATFAFAWQIFFDFSGYTDMARGLAKMMGFNLILNFNNPYMATGLGEFWQRWHISLSTWFRDYVYIPLGGSRRGMFWLYSNLFITFLISGVWHGSAWRYAIWGALHAVGVILTRELERSAFYRERVPVVFKRVGVFLYVSFAWIFFRANSLSDAFTILAGIFYRGPVAVGRFLYSVIILRGHAPIDLAKFFAIPALMVALIAAIVLYQWLYESRIRLLLRFSPVRVALAIAMILFLGLCSASDQPFIYFQF